MQSLTGNEPDLQLGDFGEWVSELQSRLRGLGHFDGPPGGAYDMQTESAVRMLQSAVGLDNDGKMSLIVWQALLQQEQLYGLEYNRFAGPLNQEWDKPGWAQQEYGDQGWVARQIAAAEQWNGPLNQGLSPDGQWQWNGLEWVPADGSFDDSLEGSTATDEVAELSPDGQWQWNGLEWVPADASFDDALGSTATDEVAQLSPDGQWQWNGLEWVPADASFDDALGSTATDEVAQLSPDGQWQWNGLEWVPADASFDDALGSTATDEVAQLSPDGQWQWNGYEWQPTDRTTGNDQAT
jgi:peptidoglycan hydrolase-like protein with peptidoglycan-binding domain